MAHLAIAHVEVCVKPLSGAYNFV